ncbi:MAG: DUF3822 family protein [Muribaculum sp.]|nr:DUF3822 family protein [Muribaculum sp.]
MDSNNPDSHLRAPYNSRRGKYSPVDLADTGMWRLLLYIKPRGMSACLRHIEDKNALPVVLFDAEWNPQESELLSNIENTVYDNPRLFDDYATEIIIEAPRTIFVPSNIIDEPGRDTELYTEVYSADQEDIFTDSLGEETALFSLGPGVPSFLQRTLPGARILSHLAVIANRYRRHTSEVARIYADIRTDEVDILAFEGTSLLSASVQSWSDPADAAYRILLLMQAYGIDRNAAEIRVSGLPEAKTTLVEMLRRMASYVVYQSEPASVAELAMPLAMALAAER